MYSPTTTPELVTAYSYLEKKASFIQWDDNEYCHIGSVLRSKWPTKIRFCVLGFLSFCFVLGFHLFKKVKENDVGSVGT